MLKFYWFCIHCRYDPEYGLRKVKAVNSFHKTGWFSSVSGKALLEGYLTLSQMSTFDSKSKLKEFADGNFKFYENHKRLYKWVENTEGKGEIAHYEQSLLFPQCF